MMKYLSLVGHDVFNDLELFNAYSNDYKDTIMYIIDKCIVNQRCKSHIINKLKHPIYNIEYLKSNQQDLFNIVSKYKNNLNVTDKLIDSIQKTENDINWLFDHSKDEIIDILDIVYFQMQFFEKLGFNKCSELLVIKNIYIILLAPIISILSPLMYILIPYFLIVYKLRFKIPLGMFLKTFTKALTQSYAFSKIFIEMQTNFEDNIEFHLILIEE